MKKIFITILAFSSFALFSQKKYIESMSFEQSQDIDFFINVKYDYLKASQRPL